MMQVQRYFRRLYYDLVLGPRGHGKPVPQSVWETQYGRGEWATLDGIDEMAHYAVIGGYAHCLHPSPAVLDVGCGPGYLLKWLNGSFESYLGLDLSQEAIAQANSRKVSNATFISANFENWQTDLRFDIVIFNEALYYANDPGLTFLRYGALLKGNGTMIVSMCQYGYNAAIWTKLNDVADWLHGTEVKNPKGQLWDIRVARLKKPPDVSGNEFQRP